MDHPSWLIPLHHAVVRVAAHRRCSRIDAAWRLREQIDFDALVFLAPGREVSRAYHMHRDEWQREAMTLLWKGVMYCMVYAVTGRGSRYAPSSAERTWMRCSVRPDRRGVITTMEVCWQRYIPASGVA
jgi:hypothetical protein